MSGDPEWYRYDATRACFVLAVHIQPNARRGGVVGLHGDALKIRIAAPAVDNKANAELVNYLSETLGVSRSAVRIRRGASGRRKVVEIAGGTELTARLAALA